MKAKSMTRRALISGMVSLAGVTVLGTVAGCTPQPAPTAQVIEKEKVVTQVVEKPVQVTTVVEKAVEVTKVVEKVVTPTAAPAAKPGAPVDILYSLSASALDLPLYKQVVDTFSREHPNITVKQNNTPFPQYEQQAIPTWAAGGTLPDVIFVRGAYGPQWASKKWTAPLDELIKRDAKEVDTDDLWPRQVDGEFKYKGKWYLLPYDYSIVGMYYNKDIFDKAQVPYPGKDWTWDDLVQMGLKMTKQEGGKTVQWGMSNLPRTYEIMAHLWAGGGGLLSADGTKCIVNQPDVKEKNAAELDSISDLRNKYKISPTAGDIPQGVSLFFTGKTGMEVNGSWSPMTFRQNIGTRFKWDCQWWPLNKATQRRGILATGAGMALGTQTKHQDEAWTFLKAITSRQAIEVLVSMPLRSVPGRQSAAKLWVEVAKAGNLDPAHVSVFPEMLDASMEYHPTVFETEIRDIAGQVLAPVFNGQKKGIDVLAEWEMRMNDAISKYKDL